MEPNTTTTFNVPAQTAPPPQQQTTGLTQAGMH